jgi:hypothetical protein
MSLRLNRGNVCQHFARAGRDGIPDPSKIENHKDFLWFWGKPGARQGICEERVDD